MKRSDITEIILSDLLYSLLYAVHILF